MAISVGRSPYGADMDEATVIPLRPTADAEPRVEDDTVRDYWARMQALRAELEHLQGVS